ncbi:MAG: RAD55 family ATPase [Ktedonobacteraceae bacterium]
MTGKAVQPPGMARLKSGIAGLDSILRGGFLTGGNYLIMGPPGVGKTILGNQLCFHHIAAGGRAIYLSLLAETSSRLLDQLQSFTFYTPDPVGDALYYLSGYAVLEREGLEGLLNMIRGETRSRRATLLVIDGSAVAKFSTSVQDWTRFLHALYVSAEITRCTTVLLMQSYQDSASLSPEQTVVEGLIELAMPTFGMRVARELRVRKFRGSDFLEGSHLYTITREGIVVHPRTEALLAPAPVELPATAPEQMSRMSVGIPRLDEMLQGGFPSGSITLLVGTSGTGKTLLGSHFLLTGAAQGKPGLYFGFNETPLRLARQMTRFGFDVSRARAEGLLEVLWQSPVQDNLDVLAERLLAAIERRGVRLLFIDGLAGFQRTVASAERLDLFLATLFTHLQALEITTICSMELPTLFSPTVELPAISRGATDLVDNMLFLRYVELESQLYRLISIIKMRESGYDAAIREFRITDRGIDVAPTFTSAQAILTGVARPAATVISSPPFAAEPARAQGGQP